MGQMTEEQYRGHGRGAVCTRSYNGFDAERDLFREDMFPTYKPNQHVRYLPTT